MGVLGSEIEKKMCFFRYDQLMIIYNNTTNTNVIQNVLKVLYILSLSGKCIVTSCHIDFRNNDTGIYFCRSNLSGSFFSRREKRNLTSSNSEDGWSTLAVWSSETSVTESSMICSLAEFGDTSNRVGVLASGAFSAVTSGVWITTCSS